MTTLKRTLTTDTHPNNDKKVSVSQFNVLANNLCETGGFDSDPAVLKWDYRKKLYKEIITNDSFDIMCFEEMDEKPLHEICSILIPLGYDYIWNQKFYTKPNEPNDGTAIFWKKDLFKLKDKYVLQYVTEEAIYQGFTQCSTQFALMVCLENISESSFSVCLAATHLKAKPGFESVRHSQIKQLMQQLSKFNVNNYPEIICGDFNDVLDSPMSQEIMKKYQSAYSNNEGHWTTCKKRKELVKRIIDYIYHDDRLLCNQVLNIPPVEVLPSEAYPSDHILIGAVFVLAK